MNEVVMGCVTARRFFQAIASYLWDEEFNVRLNGDLTLLKGKHIWGTLTQNEGGKLVIEPLYGADRGN